MSSDMALAWIQYPMLSCSLGMEGSEEMLGISPSTAKHHHFISHKSVSSQSHGTGLKIMDFNHAINVGSFSLLSPLPTPFLMFSSFSLQPQGIQMYYYLNKHYDSRSQRHNKAAECPGLPYHQWLTLKSAPGAAALVTPSSFCSCQEMELQQKHQVIIRESDNTAMIPSVGNPIITGKWCREGAGSQAQIFQIVSCKVNILNPSLAPINTLRGVLVLSFHFL